MVAEPPCLRRADEFDRQATTAGPTILATPEQVLAGQPVGPTADGALCTDCGAVIGEADTVFAYAYRCAETMQWDVPRLFCWGCAPDTIRTPTLAATEVLVGGRLGTLALPTTRTHRLCLTELAVRAYSSPTEGTRP